MAYHGITRRRLGFISAVRLVQKWFRGIRVIRLALNLFAPFSSAATSHLMPSWCVCRVHVDWIRTGENEWSQWVLSFKAKSNQVHHAISHPDAAPLSTTVQYMVMSNFGGCRTWPYNRQPSRLTNFPHVNFSECESIHRLVNPLWAASFWRNVDASLKHGVQLAHQKSRAIIIPDGLLRWSYGLAPDVSPPAKTDWRRGASRRRRRSNRGPSSEFLLSVDDADADRGDGHADGAHDDDDAGNDNEDDDADDTDDDNVDNAGDNDVSAHSFERNCDHDCQHNDRDGGVHHDGDYDDVDGHQAFASNANGGHDGDFEHGDANSGDDQDAHDQYDDRNDDRTAY